MGYLIAAAGLLLVIMFIFKGSRKRSTPVLSVRPPVHLTRPHFEYADEVRVLRHAGKLDEAADLVLALVDATEREAALEDGKVIPWYYQHLAIYYRSLKRYDLEVAIIARFLAQPHNSDHNVVMALRKRLIRAEELAAKTSPSANS